MVVVVVRGEERRGERKKEEMREREGERDVIITVTPTHTAHHLHWPIKPICPSTSHPTTTTPASLPPCFSFSFLFLKPMEWNLPETPSTGSRLLYGERDV